MDKKVIQEAVKMRDKFAEKLHKHIEAVEKKGKGDYTKDAILKEKKSHLSHARTRLKEAERAKKKIAKHWDGQIANDKKLIKKLEREIKEGT
ncbi:MAG: hypothetical protein U9P36_03010 [Thermodesulfobacteriota bacterium]|nr:hypothetical protein [Thermodesulfobacteriota bacterium]